MPTNKDAGTQTKREFAQSRGLVRIELMALTSEIA